MKKEPIWKLLVDRGFFDDRKTAESWIMAGSVFANGCKINTSGEPVDPAAAIRIKGLDQKYVSKGGLKLEGALADFGVDITGRVAIDAGASTGGFTDCLIQHGAAKVYAVDVGYGQLAGKLRQDARVENMEKVNIGDDILRTLDPVPTIASVDLSYLSLKKAIPIFAQILGGKGELICLVKPLFEVEDSEIRRSGVIEDPAVYRDLLIDLGRYVGEIGYRVAGVTHSHVTGNRGTREFFLEVELDPRAAPDAPKDVYDDSRFLADVDRAIENVLKIEPFKKA